MTRTAHNIRHIGLARARGEHLQAVNEPLPLAAMPPEPRRLPSESQAVHDARIAAQRRLGTGWVLHPAYTFTPRHSVNPDVWGPARADYLAEVAQRAAADRARNPAWHTAQRVLRALEG